MLCGCPQYSECAPGDSQLHQNKQNQLRTARLPLLCSRVRPRLVELKFLCVGKYVSVWKVTNENWCSLVCLTVRWGGGYTDNLFLTGNNILAFVGSVAQSKCVLWQLTGTLRQPRCWRVLGQASGKKASKSGVFCLADRNALHPSAMSVLHSLLLPERPPRMQVLTVATMFALTVLSRAAALLCRRTKQPELLQCVRPPEQRRLAEPSRPLQLVFAGVESGCDPGSSATVL